MATTTRSLRLAKTSEEEIMQLMDLCSELESLNELLQINYFSDIDIKSDRQRFKTVYPLWKDADGDIEVFMTNVFKQFDLIHFRRILWNCSTLLSNCANPDLDHLDFNQDIKRGIEMLVQLENNEASTNTNNISVNAEFILQLESKEEWVRKVPRHLPKKTRPGEQWLWVDKHGNVFEKGLDFEVAKKLSTYPCKVYRLQSVSSVLDLEVVTS